jgi:hypothetical protein
VKIVYYDDDGPKNQMGFRGGGSAWWVRSEPDRPWDERFAELDISEHLYVAFFKLGIMDDFYELPHDGLMGPYEEGSLLSAGLGRAADILRQRARDLSPGIYEWSCGEQVKPDKIEYRIRGDGLALKQEILALADFLEAAVARGYNVQLWL